MDGWNVPANRRDGIQVTQPKTDKERHKVAEACTTQLGISIPVVVDGVDNAVENTYEAWPDRLYIVGRDGKIVYRGARGPRGFSPREAEEALRTILQTDEEKKLGAEKR